MRLEAQRHERRLRRDDGQAELLRDPVGERCRPDLGYGEAAGRDDERGSLDRRTRGLEVKRAAFAPYASHFARLPPFDTSLCAFGAQHVDDLLRPPVAEELAEGLLVPGNAVGLDERDEIARRVTRERRAAEVGIGREKIRGRRMEVGEVAAPSPGDANLLA